jgi:hypothetical protein
METVTEERERERESIFISYNRTQITCIRRQISYDCEKRTAGTGAVDPDDSSPNIG